MHVGGRHPGPALLADLGLPLNKLGQLEVNERLETSDPHVLALGDCCAVPWRDGRSVPARAQAAHQQADYLVKKLAARLRGAPEPVEPYVYQDHGSLVSLGQDAGVGSLMGKLAGRGLFVSGTLARLMYMSLHLMHHKAVLGFRAPLPGPGAPAHAPHPSSGQTALNPHEFPAKLEHAWTSRQSLLQVGLDPDPQRFPRELQDKPDAIFQFCREIVDATAPYACSFKPQIAYFAAHRAEEQLEALCAHIRDKHPDLPIVLDAKRGDIGSTAENYAREAYERYQAHALTVSPWAWAWTRSSPIWPGATAA